MTFFIVIILCLLRYLNIFFDCMTEHIYLKKLGTMDRQKYFRNLSLKATRTAETVITKCSDSIHLFKLKNELFIRLAKLNYAVSYPSNFET